ncbi:hypothetical protein FIBSPDRAFT_1048506 [Athelia psychrophila]|uniref:G-protein coupled receptors family 3 profile domain-containing protein n=1 Tax=Athelia psychrophila TaxID=1759441 RepID=A0A166DRF0_9AGAM|nr:hypothetical protein FIBSPDRAFT_1048506 [Fibularhizoctonia sp. CBS 109695]
MLIDTSTSESFLRIAALSVGLYDYLLTLPAEWHLYRAQRTLLRPSILCILFVSIRYISIAALVISNYGYFHHGFSHNGCRHFFLIVPAIKVIQTMISQVILGIRTYNISRRARWVKFFLIGFGIVVSAMEWLVTFFSRTTAQSGGNCTTGDSGPHMTAWMFYVISMSYNFLVLSIATWQLIRVNTTDRRLIKLLRAMIMDGLGYVVALAGANIFNIILFQEANKELQTSGASLGYAMVWIMSQRILIKIQRVADSSVGETQFESAQTPAGYPMSREMSDGSVSPIESVQPSLHLQDEEKSVENHEGDISNQQRHRPPPVEFDGAL